MSFKWKNVFIIPKYLSKPHKYMYALCLILQDRKVKTSAADLMVNYFFPTYCNPALLNKSSV